MTTRETESPSEVVRRYVDTYNRCTGEYVDTCATEDIVGIRFPGGSVVVEGSEAWRIAAQEVLRSVPNRRIFIQDLVSVGPRVSAHIRYTGTVAEARRGFPPPGVALDMELLMVWLVRDGRVAAEHICAG